MVCRRAGVCPRYDLAEWSDSRLTRFCSGMMRLQRSLNSGYKQYLYQMKAATEILKKQYLENFSAFKEVA